MEVATPTAHGEEADGGVVIIQHSNDSASCRWTIQALAKRKQRTLYSRYFSVGGYDWRLLVYPAGDSQALPGYVSLYLQARVIAVRLRLDDCMRIRPLLFRPTRLGGSHASPACLPTPSYAARVQLLSFRATCQLARHSGRQSCGFACRQAWVCHAAAVGLPHRCTPSPLVMCTRTGD